jgi:hypothetical protein
MAFLNNYPDEVLLLTLARMVFKKINVDQAFLQGDELSASFGPDWLCRSPTSFLYWNLHIGNPQRCVCSLSYWHP